MTIQEFKNTVKHKYVGCDTSVPDEEPYVVRFAKKRNIDFHGRQVDFYNSDGTYKYFTFKTKNYGEHLLSHSKILWFP